ncbi:MAG: von Willebrand factor type A domain-containing protein [Ignavibacteriaceae bacterium]|nr:von Willebrand factor type A domain-containing protein [Ignavibacterium sp.]MCC6253902.1 von Willebrand factor type A domain-containing protein [Ignavibacteriaceae bacterium]HRN25605.1 von Willebrand factor type A domain-containing protein [Ignavibacteriaceae bacterium]HRP93351.1 von Willebrand factor type A domain-containing protein [Ignavibacteriaceae bacterium]HRQ53224.1 von Willebrand factor type A domain-containing protein [Ignavibacteriaceae bacterium]
MLFFTKFFAILLLSVPLFANGILKGKVTDKATGEALIGANVVIVNQQWGAATDINGYYEIKNIPAGTYSIKATYVGYEPFEKKEVVIKNFQVVELNFELETNFTVAECIVVSERPLMKISSTNTCRIVDNNNSQIYVRGGRGSEVLFFIDGSAPNFNTEEYSKIDENIFKDVFKNPLSTFSIDVDYASYSNARRYLLDGFLPPKDAVRVEEFINYFQYDYPKPTGNDPLEIYTEVSKCPWNDENLLVHIGIKGKELEVKDQKRSNLVFLIDVSGSMDEPDKLPLLVNAFKIFTEQLRDDDVVSIVVYAGSSGLVLAPTTGKDKIKIINVLDKLEAGGSTAGGEGMKLAYKIAEEYFISDGNNRVIWATDGDFNVGVSNTGDLVRFLEDKKEKGIFLTVLGFGTRNIKDNRLEQLADKGNGHYAYIDNLLEAKKVLVDEIGSTLYTIAKDVKIQVEFNPAKVKEYRLVGYENRLLNAEDFENDKKDAGEIGSGHSVTALYEIVLQDDDDVSDSNLRYQVVSLKDSKSYNKEIGNIKVRYKLPDEDESNLITKVLSADVKEIAQTSDNFRFASSVAMFAMLLRDSEFKGDTDSELILNLANKSRGIDKTGYRSEFIKLVELLENLEVYAGTVGR